MTAKINSLPVVNNDVPEIPVRRMDFVFDDSIPTLWFDGDVFRTMLLTALSCTFPEGERMFMRSVRHFQGGIKKPVLLKQVRAFIGQEANHGHEHEAFNAFMARKGLPTDKIEKFVTAAISREESWLSPERMLAKTCALEHFTAMFAEAILSRPELLSGVDERLVPLWLWHAVEESEHKAVAFDVYQDQVGSYWVRVSEMALTTVLFSFFTTLHTRQLLRAQPEPVTWAQVASGLRSLWGKKGFLKGMLPRYLDYYRPGFHPDQHDAKHLREQGLARLAQYRNLMGKAA